MVTLLLKADLTLRVQRRSLRGTQRLFSVKYLFEEVNIAWNIIFYYLV